MMMRKQVVPELFTEALQAASDTNTLVLLRDDRLKCPYTAAGGIFCRPSDYTADVFRAHKELEK